MGKNYSDNLHSINNTGTNLTLKQMVEISEKLIVGQSDEIYGVNTINWEDSSWKHLSLVNDEEVISLSHAEVYVFSDSVLCLGKVNQNPTSNIVWERQLGWFKDSSQYRILDTIDGEPMEFEWHISQESLHCSSSKMSKSSWTKWANPNNSKDESSSCRCSMTSYGELKTMHRNVLLIPHLCLFFLQKDFQQDIGHSSDLDQKQSGILFTTKDHKENGQSRWIDVNQIRRKRAPSFPCLESIVSRNGQKQRRWKIIYTLLCRWWYDWNCFLHNHFCQPAQYLRSSLRCVCGIQYVSNKYGETRIGRAIWPIGRASKLIDDDTWTFDWDSRTRKFNAEVQGTSGKASTTRSIVKDLYRCRIPENSWSRTVLHDKTYWRVCRASDMSWVYVTTRRQINWTKRLDSREHPNWTRIGSHNQLPTR